MKLSRIIVNCNLSYLPRLCIEALKGSSISFPFEIIVVDNNSRDESVRYLQKMHDAGEITLIRSKTNLGYGKANNCGATYAKGEYLLILNPDVSVEKNTLQKMADYLDQHRSTALVGPQLYFFNGAIQDSCRRFMQPFDLVIKRTPLQRFKFFQKRLSDYVMADFNHMQSREVDIVTGACMMIRRETFEKVGGFDPRYFLFMEDIDLCRKVADKGYKVAYVREARALHYHKRLSEGGLLSLLRHRIFWIHLASAGKYFWKWKGKKLPRKSMSSRGEE